MALQRNSFCNLCMLFQGMLRERQSCNFQSLQFNPLNPRVSHLLTFYLFGCEWASVVVAHGLSSSAACGIFPDHGLNLCLLQWQADSYPLYHQANPGVFSFECLLLHPFFLLKLLVEPSNSTYIIFSTFIFLSPLLNFFLFLAMLCGLWDLSSLTREWTWALWQWNLSPKHWTDRGFR